MSPLLKEIRHNKLLWLLVFVPVVFAAAKLKPEAHTLLFVLSVLAIVPLAALLPVKEVYVFVHGYDNNFNDAVMTIAEMWHFLGRQAWHLREYL